MNWVHPRFLSRAAPILTIFAAAFQADSAAFVGRPPLALSSTNVYRDGRVLIKPKPGRSPADLVPVHARSGGAIRRTYPRMGNIQVVQLPPGVPVDRALDVYRRSGLVEYAEADFLLFAARAPNEAAYTNGPLWNLYNWGQLGGTTGSDINAAEGWDIAVDATPVIVSVIDSGIRVTHEDLVENLWVNPGEIPGNGLDDDSNGYIDDVHGINAITGTGTLTDEPSHGTHVAGTIGAIGNNGIGVVGVAWRIKMMGCKFLNENFEGTVSDAVECIEYSRANGAKVINASWGGVTASHFFSNALRDAIDSLRQDGIIFVAAAGNFALDNDNESNAFYPATFDLDNIISVAATTRDDFIAHFSDYGVNSVDLGAPGYIVYSTWATGDNAYDYDNGTSMAAPHVAAACALAWTRFPNDSYQQIVARVLAGVDVVPGLAGKCRTGGRLNLRKVLDGVPALPAPELVITPVSHEPGEFRLRVSGSTNTPVIIQASLDLTTWETIFSGQTSSNGVMDFTDNQPPAGHRFYRAAVAE